MLGVSETTNQKRSTPGRKVCHEKHILKCGEGLERERRYLPGLREKINRLLWWSSPIQVSISTICFVPTNLSNMSSNMSVLFTHHFMFCPFSPSGVSTLHSWPLLSSMKANTHHHSQAGKWEKRQQECGVLQLFLPLFPWAAERSREKNP